MAEERVRQRRYARRLPPGERREQLLDAALAVLVREGYRQVSVEAIAQEAGVTRPVVYANFDGLEPLLHALLDRTQRRALESSVHLLAHEPPTEDFEGWIIRRVSEFLDLVQADPAVWRPVLGMISGTPEQVADRIAKTRTFLIGEVGEVLRTGLGRRAAGLDIEVLAELVVVNLEHLGRLALDQPERFTNERLIAAVSPIMLPSAHGTP